MPWHVRSKCNPNIKELIHSAGAAFRNAAAIWNETHGNLAVKVKCLLPDKSLKLTCELRRQLLVTYKMIGWVFVPDASPASKALAPELVFILESCCQLFNVDFNVCVWPLLSIAVTLVTPKSMCVVLSGTWCIEDFFVIRDASAITIREDMETYREAEEDLTAAGQLAEQQVWRPFAVMRDSSSQVYGVKAFWGLFISCLRQGCFQDCDPGSCNQIEKIYTTILKISTECST